MSDLGDERTPWHSIGLGTATLKFTHYPPHFSVASYPCGLQQVKLAELCGSPVDNLWVGCAGPTDAAKARVPGRVWRVFAPDVLSGELPPQVWVVSVRYRRSVAGNRDRSPPPLSSQAGLLDLARGQQVQGWPKADAATRPSPGRGPAWSPVPKARACWLVCDSTPRRLIRLAAASAKTWAGNKCLCRRRVGRAVCLLLGSSLWYSPWSVGVSRLRNRSRRFRADWFDSCPVTCTQADSRTRR